MADLPDPSRTTLKASNLIVARGGRLILRGVNLEMRRSELVTLAGSNGSGKSTLLLALTHRIEIKHGFLSYNGGRSSLRIGWANQSPRAFPTATVLEHALGPRYMAKRSHPNWRISEGQVHSILGALEFSYLASHPCNTLSAGELRIAELTRAFFHGTDILFLDEPTSGLSSMASARLAYYLQIRKNQGCSILVVTHDREWANAISPLRLRLSEGTLNDVN